MKNKAKVNLKEFSLLYNNGIIADYLGLKYDDIFDVVVLEDLSAKVTLKDYNGVLISRDEIINNYWHKMQKMSEGRSVRKRKTTKEYVVSKVTTAKYPSALDYSIGATITENRSDGSLTCNCAICYHHSNVGLDILCPNLIRYMQHRKINANSVRVNYQQPN